MERGGAAPVKSVKLGLSQIEAPWGAGPPPSNLRCAEWQGPSNLWRAGGPWAPARQSARTRAEAAGPERRERAHSLDMFDVCTNYNVQCLSKLTSSAEARAPPSNEAVKKNSKIRALGPPLSKMSKA